MVKGYKYVNDMTINYNFAPLPDGEELPKLAENDIKSLFTNAYISYRYVNAIKSGKLSPDLANLKCSKKINYLILAGLQQVWL